MKPETQKTKRNNNVLIIIVAIIFVFLILGGFLFYIYNTQNNTTVTVDSDMPTSADIGVAREYINRRASNAKISGELIIDHTFNEGCVNSPAYSGFITETVTKCTYRNLTFYSVGSDTQTFLNQLRARVVSDGWDGHGAEPKSYDRYDALLEKRHRADLHIKVYTKDSLTSVFSNDYDLLNGYAEDENNTPPALDTIEKELQSKPESTFIGVDIKYTYFWKLE